MTCPSQHVIEWKRNHCCSFHFLADNKTAFYRSKLSLCVGLMFLEKLKTMEVRRSACVYLQEEEIVVGFNTRLKTR